MSSDQLHRRRVPTRPIPIGMDGRWFLPGRYEDVLEHAGFSGPRLAEHITRALADKES